MRSARHIIIFLIGIATIGLSPASGSAHTWKAPKHEANRQSPSHGDQQSIKAGATSFAELCGGCHGVEGKGLPGATTGLSHDTTNLPKSLIKHSDGDFHWKIKTGKGEMPGFAEKLSDDEIWNIVDYIRSLAK